MKLTKSLILALLLYLVTTSACIYVVLPEGVDIENLSGSGGEAKGWAALVTEVSKPDKGGLRINLAIRNDTGDWSAMRAADGKPAILTTSDGKTTQCATVFVGTGGHRLAPGFQMRGYTNNDLTTQPLHVECEGASATQGAKLSIEYVSFNGILDDYDPEANKAEGKLELKLDEIATNLSYPVATPIEGLIQPGATSLTGLSENVVTLLEAQRTETGFQFKWQNFNPSKFPLKTHIGIPPVIGADGILYGVYETIDLSPIPITPPKANIEWTTEVAVPNDVKGFYILLSLESKKPRTYINYVLDIHEK